MCYCIAYKQLQIFILTCGAGGAGGACGAGGGITICCGGACRKKTLIYLLQSLYYVYCYYLLRRILRRVIIKWWQNHLLLSNVDWSWIIITIIGWTSRSSIIRAIGNGCWRYLWHSSLIHYLTWIRWNIDWLVEVWWWLKCI